MQNTNNTDIHNFFPHLLGLCINLLLGFIGWFCVHAPAERERSGVEPGTWHLPRDAPTWGDADLCGDNAKPVPISRFYRESIVCDLNLYKKSGHA
jgi:hypothetical protein